jgi:hypothetical protein
LCDAEKRPRADSVVSTAGVKWMLGHLAKPDNIF